MGFPDNYETEDILVGGGLRSPDNPLVLHPGEAKVLRNISFEGEGWWATRRAAAVFSSSYVGEPVGVYPFPHLSGVAAVLITWDASAEVCRIYTLNANGVVVSDVGELAGWTGVDAKPRMSGAVLNRVLFLCDQAQVHGLTIYDPLDILASGTELFQPTFDFAGGGAAPALPHALGAWSPGGGQNIGGGFLLMFCYGTEQQQDVPNAVRFSYLNLIADDEGEGDAGETGVAGSQGLFDIGDMIPVGKSGLRLHGGKATTGRFVTGNPESSYGITGFDRFSIRADPLDENRGLGNPDGIVTGGGAAWWWAPKHGPTRHLAGTDDLSAPILDKLPLVDPERVIVCDDISNSQVLFLSPGWKGAFSYAKNRWVEIDLPGEISCAGQIGVDGSISIAPFAPTNLQFDNITDTSARATWQSNLTGIGGLHRVYRAVESSPGSGLPGTFALIQDVYGSAEITFSFLAQNTRYWVRVTAIRDGVESAPLEEDFTTLGSGTVPPPADFSVTNDPQFVSGSWQHGVLLQWTHPSATAVFEIEVSDQSITAFFLTHTTGPGARSWHDAGPGASPIKYRVRALDGGLYSAYAGPINITPTVP